MTTLKQDMEAATGTYSTNAATLPASGGLTTIVVLGAGSTIVSATDQVDHGTKSLKINPASGSSAAVKGTGFTASRNVSADAHFRYPSVPTIEVMLARLAAATSNVIWATYLPTGFIRVRTTGSNNLYTSTTAFPLNAHTRLGLGVRLHATDPLLSTFRCAAFPLDSDTPISGIDSGWTSTALITVNAAVDIFSAARISTEAETTAFWLGDMRVDNAASDLITVIPGSRIFSGWGVPIAAVPFVAEDPDPPVTSQYGSATYDSSTYSA